ncbi:MAG: histidine--tRNA ligase [Patescibacteria group bacterium]
MLSVDSYKGVRDFFPEDIKLRNYIFSTWRKVCESFGFEEYDGPFLEPFELFASKSGEELVNQQLYSFEDRANRKVAIRPEMTPTVSRMAAKKMQEGYPIPIKWFSIANFYRYEKPQKGRGREFYQLNVDIFGENSVEADLENLLLNNALMKAFNAKPEMYKIRVNNRYLLNYLFDEVVKASEEQKLPLAKAIDTKEKVSDEDFNKVLLKLNFSQAQVAKIIELLTYKIEDIKSLKNLPEQPKQLLKLFELIEKAGLKSIVFDPTIVRGLDYYDGNVFEQFDMTPGNNRSMFGGGRYDGLISLFINKKVPAVGFAQGDITLTQFLKDWNLIPNFTSSINVLVTVFPNNPNCYLKSLELAQKLRGENITSELFLDPKAELNKQIKYADKKKIPFVLIIGPDELAKNSITVKNMLSGAQNTTSTKDIRNFINSLPPKSL